MHYYLFHDLIRFRRLLRHFLCVCLQPLERTDDGIVVQDLALRFVERGKQRLFELAQANCELSLQLEQVAALLVDVRSLATQDLVQALHFETASSHGEVYERHSRAYIRREFDLNLTIILGYAHVPMLTDESLVTKKILKAGDRSIS